MATGFQINPVRSDIDVRAASALFEGYAASLSVDLDYQDFRTEVAGLPGKYTPPRGELLLARAADGAPLGCVGVRPLAREGCCEMKRLFLMPAARELGVGRALAEAIVIAAQELGYRELRLDTLPGMAAAIRLYERMGFVRIAPYYAPTPDGTIFMSLTL